MPHRLYEVQGSQKVAASAVRLRCPFCKHQGAFEPVGPDGYDVRIGEALASIRRCPTCMALVFLTYDGHPAEVQVSFPPEVIDFDTTGLPASVVDCLNEAVLCHAEQCYRAAAIMIRRTLEEVCAHNGATGDNLAQRLKALGQKALLPAPLIDGLTDLRLLGNDAAHIEATTYEQVGEGEVRVGINVTKLVLQAVYQYASAMDELASLKAEQT